MRHIFSKTVSVFQDINDICIKWHFLTWMFYWYSRNSNPIAEWILVYSYNAVFVIYMCVCVCVCVFVCVCVRAHVRACIAHLKPFSWIHQKEETVWVNLHLVVAGVMTAVVMYKFRRLSYRDLPLCRRARRDVVEILSGEGDEMRVWEQEKRVGGRGRHGLTIAHYHGHQSSGLITSHVSPCPSSSF